MFTQNISRRSFVAGAASLPLVGSKVALAQPVTPIGPDDEFAFWVRDSGLGPGWNEVIQASWLDATARSGRYTITLEFTPTQEEKSALMEDLVPSETVSHVDIVFTIDGLVPASGATVFGPGGGDHIRYAGAEVAQDGSRTIFTTRCWNIEKRWDAGVPILATAALSGYKPSHDGVEPKVSVQLLPCAYQMVYEDPGDAEYERTTDDVTKFYRRWGLDGAIILASDDGRTQFGFR